MVVHLSRGRVLRLEQSVLPNGRNHIFHGSTDSLSGEQQFSTKHAGIELGINDIERE